MAAAQMQKVFKRFLFYHGTTLRKALQLLAAKTF